MHTKLSAPGTNVARHCEALSFNPLAGPGFCAHVGPPVRVKTKLSASGVKVPFLILRGFSAAKASQSDLFKKVRLKGSGAF